MLASGCASSPAPKSAIPSSEVKVSSLHVYPVKSARGHSVAQVAIDVCGFTHDRRFLIVDGQDRFLTQRNNPALARLETTLHADGRLELATAGRRPIAVPFAPGPPRRVTIWNDTVEAVDCGNEVAVWLTAWLGAPSRLVRCGAAWHRPVRRSPGDQVAFADAYPLLVISQASLNGLNERLDFPVPMDRFRPNLVLAGATEPHIEDTWPRLRVGDVVLRAAGPCGRCIVTTTDQLTGERGREPLHTLATYRRSARGEIEFGQNFIAESRTGSIRVGDPVEPLLL
jgi:uncharacterized protein YcbX